MILITRTDVSDASNKVVGLAEDVDASPLDDVPEANGAVVGGRGGDRTVELNPGHAAVVAGQGQYHIADVYVPDDDPRILHAGRARENVLRVPACKRCSCTTFYLVSGEQDGCVEIDGGHEIFVRLNAALSD